MQLSLYNDTPSSQPAAGRFRKESVLKKLEALDSKARRKGLSGLSPVQNTLVAIGMESADSGAVTKNGYGVFHLPWLAARHPEWAGEVRAEAEKIQEGIHQAHGQPLRFLVWAGMGGSAEDKSMLEAAGLLRKGPRCYILDSTDPAKLKAILADMQKRAGSLDKALRSTLVAGMAMGMTSFEPVVNLEKLSRIYHRLGIDSTANFVYMTLPGSLLDRFASARGYRKIELQLDGGNATAGRHSSPMTRGSLLPLALARADLDSWLAGAGLEPEAVETAFRLSAFLHQQGIAGRDKITFLPSRPVATASLWTKQNFEESLGKSEESGIKIVIGERPRAANYRRPNDPRQDRVFLAVERKGETGIDRQKLAVIRRSGYPVAHLLLEKGAPLSRYLQFVHYAVFGLAWLRRMNFVTQPGVELYKSITQQVFENGRVLGGTGRTPEWQQMRRTPRQIKWRGCLTFYYDRLRLAVDAEGRDAPSVYAAILRQLADARAVEYGELTFFGDTRYSQPGKALRRRLERAGERVFRRTLRMPVDIYEGPAMNHSYHEMIIGHGRCFSTVLVSMRGESMPEAGYTADYHHAQFLATQLALEHRARPVVSLVLDDLSEKSLDALDSFYQEVARSLKR